MGINRLLKENDTLLRIYMYVKNKTNQMLYNDLDFFKRNYKKIQGEYPDITNPSTYFEKIIWSMLNYRNSLYIQCADKFSVRDYVSKRLNENILIDCIAVYEDENEIELDKLPNSFVLNASHGSGMIHICLDKNKINLSKIKAKMRYWLSQNYYEWCREWPYKYIKPRILCMEYIGDEFGNAPHDYKIYCFKGEPKFIQLDIDRYANHKRNLYDIGWNQLKGVELGLKQDYDKEYKIPDNFESMLQIAKILSKEFEHVRIDLYNVNGKIYFGEMTFYTGAGFSEYFKPKSFHVEIGSWFDLPPRNIETWKF